MNLDQIKLFIAVYKARSFAAVAKELDMAPSSVSRAVAALEDQLQTRLFQRTTRSLAPTQLGEAYFQRVETLIDELDYAQQEIFNQTEEPFGTLRVTASTSFGQTVLAPLLKEFYNRYPKIRLELILTDTFADMIEGRLDLAIRHGHLNDSSLIARKLLEVNYLLVADKSYLENAKAIKIPGDIQTHPLISFGFSPFDKNWRFRQGTISKTIPIKPVLTTTTASTIKECVKSGMGIALLPDWIVSTEIESGRLVSILPDWQIAGSDFDSAIWLVYPSRNFVPAKTTAMIDYLTGCRDPLLNPVKFLPPVPRTF